MITPWAYFISEFKVILHYLWIFIWPFNISVEYDWVLSKSFFALRLLVAIFSACLGCCLIIALLRRNKTDLIVFGLLWFFVYIAPRSTIIPSAELIVDYKTYGASMGWLFVIGIRLCWLYRLYNFMVIPIQLGKVCATIAILPISCVLLCLFGYQTVVRNTIWRFRR